ncbi:hypothetical protein RhiirA4_466347 [Rhizophagus irregularis]|uniref:Uncharacterized protein n=1 Tax=Rhizophagus irregularis TaxID=588596 RepID=A0A2I1GU39_9GLOM|nr:hypothetical protein RhiirA4_466347 [Rhizophagus irregularis]
MRKNKDNYEKLQEGKKAIMYNLISTEIIKTKSSDSIKCRIKHLLEKYKNINQSKNQLAERKFELERDRMDKKYKLQSERLEVEKQKWEYKREQARIRHELLMKKLELQLAQH